METNDDKSEEGNSMNFAPTSYDAVVGGTMTELRRPAETVRTGRTPQVTAHRRDGERDRMHALRVRARHLWPND